MADKSAPSTGAEAKSVEEKKAPAVAEKPKQTAKPKPVNTPEYGCVSDLAAQQEATANNKTEK